MVRRLAHAVAVSMIALVWITLFCTFMYVLGAFLIYSNFLVIVAMILGVCFSAILGKRLNVTNEEPSTIRGKLCMLLVLMPFFAIVLPSTFILFLHPQEDSKIGIIGGKTTLQERFIYFVPLVDFYEWVTPHQSINTEVIAITKDGKRVKGHIYAEMDLHVNEPMLLELAARFNGVDEHIQKELYQELERKFQEAVAKRNLEELSEVLTIEWETGNGVSEHVLTSLNVEWSGTLVISNIHPYFSNDTT